jgi:hypothetical protein
MRLIIGECLPRARTLPALPVLNMRHSAMPALGFIAQTDVYEIPEALADEAVVSMVGSISQWSMPAY